MGCAGAGEAGAELRALVAEVADPEVDVAAGLLPQPATATVSAATAATPATTVRETLIASRSFQAPIGDTVESF